MTATKKTADESEKLPPATEVAASGAIIEPAIATGIDMSHPAVDASPRDRSTVDMNKIDFNVPSALASQEDQVAEELDNED